ncbi:sulfatase-like hydrolase/transferase [Pelagibius sp. Alg239-R121]|uniref:sulfatase-like hydrolase/transferase n=1 Tax=Pelagibius sp. Alg239-R121 TaxID=2993448 RepID=UPI0024A657ED|nr:sulfatase-like hydrolase/transferase [Pelagibius sp. Alg239-R121]
MGAPNVLILCSDEHARSAAGCYGHTVVQTPTLDRLAAQGTRFTRAYTPSPICVPARASLATGLHVHETRCWSSAEPYHGQIESWMHRLRAGGQTVVSIGKLHFRLSDDDNGFSEEILPMHVTNGGMGWPQGLLRNPLPTFESVAELAAETGPGESDYTEYDRRVTREACNWLRGRPLADAKAPWSLFVSFVSPHYPLTAPKPFFDLYDGCEIPDPLDRETASCTGHPVLREMAGFWDYDSHFDPDKRRLARRCYYGLCSFLDDNIRQVLEALEDSEQARDTLILYLSDHGEMLGNHGFWTKSLMYEDSVAIPFLLAGAGVPRSVNRTPISLTDVAATVEQAAGLSPKPAAEAWQGRPLQSFVEQPEPGRFILSEYHDGGSPTGFFMLRQGAWKYVYYAGGYPSQLFNLEEDPRETNDLSSSGAAEVAREALHKQLISILNPEAVNRAAFSDQASLLAQYGGAEKVLAMQSFNHTPVD